MVIRYYTLRLGIDGNIIIFEEAYRDRELARLGRMGEIERFVKPVRVPADYFFMEIARARKVRIVERDLFVIVIEAELGE